MALIQPQDMTTLYDASYLLQVSEGADLEHEIMTIAALCNNAANTGETRAIWDKPISPAAKAKLEEKGYTVSVIPNSAIKNSMYTIMWT